MSTTPVLISVDEYLSTVYRPDCDYVDGEVLERNMGEKPHARLQTFFVRYFAPFERKWNFETLPEQRIRIAERRYRVPDIALVPLNDDEPLIVASAPLLCIEILSSKDRMGKVQERIADHASLGVKTSWVIDPWRRIAYTAGTDAVLRPSEGILAVPGTGISIEVSTIFAESDRHQKPRKSAALA